MEAALQSAQLPGKWRPLPQPAVERVLDPHMHLGQAVSDHHRRQILGNQYVDEVAKEARARHPQQDEAFAKKCSWQFACCKATCRAAAAIMPLFPRVEGKLPRTAKARAEGTTYKSYGRVRVQHDWKPTVGGLRCARCWSTQAATAKPCMGRSPLVARMAKEPNGHFLHGLLL